MKTLAKYFGLAVGPKTR